MKTTKKETSALEWLVELLREDVMRPDEFTARDAYEKLLAAGVKTTLATVRNRLAREADSGTVIERPITLNGHKTLAYSRPAL